MMRGANDSMNAPEKYFAQPDALATAPDAFARLVTQAVAVENKTDFIALTIESLHPIFSHGMLLAGLGHAVGNSIEVEEAVGINYPISNSCCTYREC